MSNNAKGSVYLKDSKGNKITDNKGNNIGFLNADSNQYNNNTLLTNTYPPSPPNGGTSLRSNDPRRNLGTALESQTRAAASQVANVGSGAITPIHPEDYALLGYGAAKTVTNIAKNRAAKGAVAKATEKGIGTNQNYQFNMIENPGPLSQVSNIPKDNPALNFAGGKYNSIILDKDIVLYRAGKGGGGKNALGQWFTEKPVKSIAQVRIDLAVKPQWIDNSGALTGSSPIESVYAIRIPKGTTIYKGPVANQGGVYVGGRNVEQIYVDKPWTIKGVEVISENSLGK